VLAAGLSAGAEVGAASTRVDRVWAVVGDRVITESELRLEQALAAVDPSPVPPLEARRADPERFLIELAIVRALAGSTAVYQPEPARVRERMEAVRAAHPTPAAWAAFLKEHGLNEDALRATLYSRMVVERYVQRNLGLAARAEAGADWDARYAAWIDAQRARVLIREIAELPAPEAGGSPAPARRR
jgi:hypothetical protein